MQFSSLQKVRYTKRDLFFTQWCGNFIKHYQSFFYEWYIFLLSYFKSQNLYHPIHPNVLINTIILRSVLIKLCYYSSSQRRKRRSFFYVRWCVAVHIMWNYTSMIVFLAKFAEKQFDHVFIFPFKSSIWNFILNWIWW